MSIVWIWNRLILNFQIFLTICVRMLILLHFYLLVRRWLIFVTTTKLFVLINLKFAQLVRTWWIDLRVIIIIHNISLIIILPLLRLLADSFTTNELVIIWVMRLCFLSYFLWIRKLMFSCFNVCSLWCMWALRPGNYIWLFLNLRFWSSLMIRILDLFVILTIFIM